MEFRNSDKSFCDFRCVKRPTRDADIDHAVSQCAVAASGTQTWNNIHFDAGLGRKQDTEAFDHLVGGAGSSDAQDFPGQDMAWEK